MKLMFLCHGAGNGGAERVITTLASEFSKRKYEVVMVTTNAANNDYQLAEGVRRQIIEITDGNIITRTIKRIKKLSDFIYDFAPDCIISFSAVPNIQVLIATLLNKRNIIISERTDPSKYPTSKVGRLLRTILYPRADRIIFQTVEAKKYFGKIIQKKSEIIFNPIRDDLPVPYCGVREKRIVGIGSLGEQKNWMLALEACEKFFEKHPEYIFEIFGEGPNRGELEKYIENSSQLNGRVYLKGFSSDAVERMNRARMYISTSNYEGISNAMLEALAIGVPTICTDCPVGGAREFIISEENGLLIPVGGVQELVASMQRIAEDDILCEKLSTNSIEIKKKLKLSKIVDMWEEEVNKVCLKK